MRERWVTIGELAQFQEVHKVGLPSFDKELYKGVEVIKSEEVDGKGVGCAVPGFLPVGQRRGRDRDARDVEKTSPERLG